MVSTGLNLADMTGKLSPAVDRLRQEWLPDTKDFYADMLLAEVPYLSYKGEFLQALHEFAHELPITHVYEFKYLSAFPTLSRNVTRQDAIKLMVIGDYLHAVSGKTPHLEQVIFNFPASDYPRKTTERIRSWFETDGFLALVPNVNVTVVDHSGAITSVQSCAPEPHREPVTGVGA